MSKLFLQCNQCAKVMEDTHKAKDHSCGQKGQGFSGMLNGGKRTYSIVEQSE